MILYSLIIFFIGYIFFFELKAFYVEKLKNINLKTKNTKKNIIIIIIFFIILLCLVINIINIENFLFKLGFFFFVYSFITIILKICFLRIYYFNFKKINKIFYFKNISNIAYYKNISIFLNYLLFLIFILSLLFKLLLFLLFSLLFKLILSFVIFLFNINLNKDFNLSLYEYYYDTEIFYKASGILKINLFKLFILTKFSDYNFLDRNDFYLLDVLKNNFPNNNYIVLKYFTDFEKK